VITDRTAALAELRAALGAALSTDPRELDAARADKSGQRSAAAPLAIVHAASVADVQAALRIASAHRLPVVPRGAGTGLAGGAMAGADRLVLSTARMTRIHEIDAVDQIAVVEPGVIVAELDAAAREQGLFYAPDPASRAWATIGGTIATGAGGLMCVKYGVTREAVLGLDVVLADGTLMRLGHRTVKGVTGLDLVGLMVGSEGTLGVVVGATVRLLPVPAGTTATIGAHLPSVVAAGAASAAIMASGVRPAALEIIDPLALSRIHAYLGLPLPLDGTTHLLMQTDGPQAIADAESALALVRAAGGDGDVSTDDASAEQLLTVRRSFHAAMEAHGTVLIEDVAVPRRRLPEMFAAIERISAEFGVEIPTVAHAGDGNLHPNFVYSGDAVPEPVWQAAHAVFREALALGGTLTGEHGVGVLKKRHLVDELGEHQLALQRRIKAAFDPLGIMNPDAVF
jgi:glycolate oxidase